MVILLASICFCAVGLRYLKLKHTLLLCHVFSLKSALLTQVETLDSVRIRLRC